MQVVLNVKGSFRTTGSGHIREVAALYRWSLEQVPLLNISYHVVFPCHGFYNIYRPLYACINIMVIDALK